MKQILKKISTYLRAVVTRSPKRFSHVYIFTTLIPDMISLIIRTLSSVSEAVFALNTENNSSNTTQVRHWNTVKSLKQTRENTTLAYYSLWYILLNVCTKGEG